MGDFVGGGVQRAGTSSSEIQPDRRAQILSIHQRASESDEWKRDSLFGLQTFRNRQVASSTLALGSNNLPIMNGLLMSVYLALRDRCTVVAQFIGRLKGVHRSNPVLA